MASKGKDKPQLKLGFTKLLEPPFERFIGRRLKVFGTWWPGCDPGDRFKMFNVIVVSFDQQFKRTLDSQAKLMFQVGLINDDDLHFTREGKKEDIDYWFVTLSQISAEINRNDDEEAKERARSEGEISQQRAPIAESETIETTERKKGSAIWQYFDKVEDSLTSGGKPSAVYTGNIVPAPPGGHYRITVTDSTNPMLRYLEKNYPAIHASIKGQKLRDAEETYGFDDPVNFAPA